MSRKALIPPTFKVGDLVTLTNKFHDRYGQVLRVSRLEKHRNEITVTNDLIGHGKWTFTAWLMPEELQLATGHNDKQP